MVWVPSVDIVNSGDGNSKKKINCWRRGRVQVNNVKDRTHPSIFVCAMVLGSGCHSRDAVVRQLFQNLVHRFKKNNV